MADDPEGDALEREIAQDRADAAARRRRRLLFLPPLVALAIAAWALGVSRPREVLAARVYAGGAPPAGQPLQVRVEVVRALPGVEGAWVVPDVELRVFADHARGRAEATDARGVAEIVIDPPLPPRLSIDARQRDGTYRAIGDLAIAALRPADPSDGKLPLRRTGGAASGELKIAVGPELGALAPPLPGAAWIRVRDVRGAPVVGAILTLQAEGGLSADPAPAVTDAGGLARVALAPIAAPVVLTVKAEKDAARGSWSGVVGSVLGAPRPSGDGRLPAGTRAIELLASASHATAYWDLWQRGVRLAGGRVAFAMGRATLALPEGLSGVLSLEVGQSPYPASAEDLAHAATWPLVLAKDDVDAWGAVRASPRFDEVQPSSGTLASYGDAVAATLALAPPAVPARALLSDGLPSRVEAELSRARAVRRAASAAVVGGGVLEIGLMMALGVLGAPPTAAEALQALASEGEAASPVVAQEGRAVVGFLVAGVGIVALIFASLAVMAWGLP